jgi:hypothetical protein
MNDPRVQAAREATAKAQQELAALEAQQHEGPVAGALYAAAKKKVQELKQEQEVAEAKAEAAPRRLMPRTTTLPKIGKGGKGWTLGQARTMLMQGYTLEAVVRRTGFGTEDFDDIPLRDGRGVSRDEWMEACEKRAAKLEREGRKLV